MKKRIQTFLLWMTVDLPTFRSVCVSRRQIHKYSQNSNIFCRWLDFTTFRSVSISRRPTNIQTICKCMQTIPSYFHTFLWFLKICQIKRITSFSLWINTEITTFRTENVRKQSTNTQKQSTNVCRWSTMSSLHLYAFKRYIWQKAFKQFFCNDWILHISDMSVLADDPTRSAVISLRFCAFKRFAKLKK